MSMDSETQTVIFYFGYSKFGTEYLSTQPYRYLKTDILDMIMQRINTRYAAVCYIDEAKRVEVERKFSLAKRKCGIGLTVTKLKEFNF